MYHWLTLYLLNKYTYKVTTFLTVKNTKMKTHTYQVIPISLVIFLQSKRAFQSYTNTSIVPRFFFFQINIVIKIVIHTYQSQPTNYLITIPHLKIQQEYQQEKNQKELMPQNVPILSHIVIATSPVPLIKLQILHRQHAPMFQLDCLFVQYRFITLNHMLDNAPVCNQMKQHTIQLNHSQKTHSHSLTHLTVMNFLIPVKITPQTTTDQNLFYLIVIVFTMMPVVWVTDQRINYTMQATMRMYIHIHALHPPPNNAHIITPKNRYLLMGISFNFSLHVQKKCFGILT
eukprot:TRINITY_DN21099_c0_g3_i4.p2 TRINITY_DN21099_c0_g3~~TRINITY_DN21099_c0_g3_i4.p2  ORF type:complete len:287 (-),score=-22.14 TRINITY_DN21099_c0_g3_i4:1310-2170(-)